MLNLLNGSSCCDFAANSFAHFSEHTGKLCPLRSSSFLIHTVYGCSFLPSCRHPQFKQLQLPLFVFLIFIIISLSLSRGLSKPLLSHNLCYLFIASLCYKLRNSACNCFLVDLFHFVACFNFLCNFI